MNFDPYIARFLADLCESGITDLHGMEFGKCEFRQNLRRESCALRKGVNELLPKILLFFDIVPTSSNEFRKNLAQ